MEIYILIHFGYMYYNRGSMALARFHLEHSAVTFLDMKRVRWQLLNISNQNQVTSYCRNLMYIFICAATWQNQQSVGAPSEDSDQPGHPPSLIRVFAVRMKKAWVLSYPLNAQRRLWSDWADAQADLSLRWAHSHFAGFIMSRLIYRLFENSFQEYGCETWSQNKTFSAILFLLLLAI